MKHSNHQIQAEYQAQSFDVAMKHIVEIYPQRIGIAYDVNSIKSIRFDVSQGKIESACVTYTKICIKDHDEKHVFWPILPYEVQISKDEAIKLMKELCE